MVPFFVDVGNPQHLLVRKGVAPKNTCSFRPLVRILGRLQVFLIVFGLTPPKLGHVQFQLLLLLQRSVKRLLLNLEFPAQPIPVLDQELELPAAQHIVSLSREPLDKACWIPSATGLTCFSAAALLACGLPDSLSVDAAERLESEPVLPTASVLVAVELDLLAAADLCDSPDPSGPGLHAHKAQSFTSRVTREPQG